MQYKGLFWRALAVVLGCWAAPLQAAPANDQARKQAKVMYEFFLEKMVEFGWGKLALLLLGVLVAGFFVSFLVARLLAGKNGTMGRTLRYYIYSFLLSVAIAAISSVLAFVCVRFGAAGGAVIIGFFALLGFVIVAFAVPMVVFDIGFLRALGLNILIAIGNGVVQAGMAAVVPNPLQSIAGKSDTEIRQVIAEWDMKRRQKAMEERMNQLPGAAPVQETVAAQAQRLYEELQKVRAELDVNDQAAVEKFNARVTEYNAVKAQLIPAKPKTDKPQ